MADLVFTLYNSPPVPPAPTQMATSVEHVSAGVTYHFSTAVEVGHYWDGSPFVVSNGGDIIITQITPESDTGTYQINDSGGTGARTVHGTMVQPGNLPHGFDSVTLNFDAATNVDPGETGQSLTIPYATYPGGASVVKANSLLDMTTQRDRQAVDKFSILTVVPEIPRQNAFRPPVVGSDKTSAYALAHLDFTKLKSLATVTGQPPIADFAYLKEAIYVSWCDPMGGEELRYIHPNAYHDGYGDYQLDEEMGAFMALHSDYSNAEKADLYAAIVQRGIDYAGAVDSGVITYEAPGGHNSHYKPFVVTAAVALDAQALRDAAAATGVYNEDYQTRYVPAEWVGQENFEGSGSKLPKIGNIYQDVHVGLPEWVNDVIGRQDPSLRAAYRHTNADNMPVLALMMEMLGDGEGRTVWSHEAYFDHAERMRLIHNVNPAPVGVSGIHGAEPEWLAWLNAYHATHSAGPNAPLPPEYPEAITLTPSSNSISVTVGGDIFPGSSPVTRVDLRWKPHGGSWTEVLDFGYSGSITGLTPGTVYLVQARYVSAVGAGPWSWQEFVQTNDTIKNSLIAGGFITQGDIDAAGGETPYYNSEAYKTILRAMVAGDPAYTALYATGVSTGIAVTA